MAANVIIKNGKINVSELTADFFGREISRGVEAADFTSETRECVMEEAS